LRNLKTAWRAKRPPNGGAAKSLEGEKGIAATAYGKKIKKIKSAVGFAVKTPSFFRAARLGGGQLRERGDWSKLRKSISVFR
jgi:hypothetical protein